MPQVIFVTLVLPPALQLTFYKPLGSILILHLLWQPLLSILRVYYFITYRILEDMSLNKFKTFPLDELHEYT